MVASAREVVLRVLVPGGTGLLGTAVVRALRARGDEAIVLTRGPGDGKVRVTWDPSRGIPQVRRFEGLDAVVNLVGEPLASRPWTSARRRILVDSRVGATESLQRSLEKLDAPPRVLVGVGSLGRFGDRGEDWIDDDDPPGTGFLADLSIRWEDAHLSAADALKARGAVLRMGMVIAAEGGAVPPLLGPFRFGFGGWIGRGTQFTPWISLEDATRAILHLLDHGEARGGFNGSIPDPVANRAWCEALGRALGKPVRTHAPKWALRGALGELADGIFLASLRARPRKLQQGGFAFEDPDVEQVFRRVVAARSG